MRYAADVANDVVTCRLNKMVLSTHGDVIQIIDVHEYWYEQVIFRRERDQNL